MRGGSLPVVSCDSCGEGVDGTVYEMRGDRLCADCYTHVPMPTDLPTPAAPQIPGSEILTEAHALVNRDRGNAYGHPADDYGRTVAAFNALTGHELSTADGVLFMVCVKLSREQERHGTDNLRDLAGYSACLEMVHRRT